jgi:hypothetical protein
VLAAGVMGRDAPIQDRQFAVQKRVVRVHDEIDQDSQRHGAPVGNRGSAGALTAHALTFAGEVFHRDALLVQGFTQRTVTTAEVVDVELFKNLGGR